MIPKKAHSVELRRGWLYRARLRLNKPTNDFVECSADLVVVVKWYRDAGQSPNTRKVRVGFV
jgi:hypothetical protein